MKIEVVSKEYITPSSPTPEILKNYKLSLLDQLAVNFNVPFVLFFKPAQFGTHELKKSLSQTLSLMYPLAGRLKEDKITIECNDEGVEFIEAHVTVNMSSVLDNIENIDNIRKLFPESSNAGGYEPVPVGKALAVIQLNRFSCGGMAISLIISHAIADGASTATFFNTWADINRGCAVDADAGFVFNCSGIFPPVINTSFAERLARFTMEKIEQRQETYETRRFVFSSSSVAQLREKLRLNNGQRPTRTEALAAFVWAAIIRATKKCDPGTVKAYEFSTIVNLRNRMVPSLPPNCLGNNILSGTSIRLEGTDGSIINCHSLVKKIRDSHGMVNHGFARKMYGYLQAMLSGSDGSGGSENLHQHFEKVCFHLHTSSLLGIPYYNTDFGWGKPIYAFPTSLRKDSPLILINNVNGEVDAWMGLPKEVMNILSKDRHFLAFVSSFPKSKL